MREESSSNDDNPDFPLKENLEGKESKAFRGIPYLENATSLAHDPSPSSLQSLTKLTTMMHQSANNTVDSNQYDHPNNGSPPAKKARCSKPRVDDVNNGGDEANSSTAASTIVDLAKRAWEHYRNYMDGNDDTEDDEEEGDTGDESSSRSNEHRSSHKVHTKEHEGDVDELLELIEILSSSLAAAIPPLLFSDSSSSSTNSSKTNPLLTQILSDKSNEDGGVLNCLIPILLSMSYVHLANHAVAESYMTASSSLTTAIATTTTTTTAYNRQDASFSLSSPEYFFEQALHYWPTNPIAIVLYANYHRMHNRSSTMDVCDMYVNASENAVFWRRAALEFLERGVGVGLGAVGGGDEEGRKNNCDKEVDTEDEEGINANEWVELLVLNGALDVDNIGTNDDDDEENDDDSSELHEEEYSTSGVEATASFMSAFLLSTLSKHDEALLHLQKFRLSHRIHPNVWLAAESEATAIKQDKAVPIPSAASSFSPSLLFQPRSYGKDVCDRSNKNHGRGILPPELYQRMCALFAPNAPYWKESNYDHRGYYSYFIDLSHNKNNGVDSLRDHPTNVIEDVIANHLLPLAEQVLQESMSIKSESSSASSSPPPPSRIVGAEWWTHTRPLGANLGHQIHFDTDESLLVQEKRVAHPIISSVLYLTGATRGECQGNGAGSTIIFDQTPESTEVAPQAWISHPRDNSLMAFPGNLLHGVLPCNGTRWSKGLADAATDDNAATIHHRLTFMVGFWTQNVTEGMDTDRELYTPCGNLPSPSEHSWVKQCQQGYGISVFKPRTEKQWMNEENCKMYDVLPSVSPAWEHIICSGGENEGEHNYSALTIPKGLDHRFFVRNAPHCFAESLYEK